MQDIFSFENIMVLADVTSVEYEAWIRKSNVVSCKLHQLENKGLNQAAKAHVETSSHYYY